MPVGLAKYDSLQLFHKRKQFHLHTASISQARSCRFSLQPAQPHPPSLPTPPLRLSRSPLPMKSISKKSIALPFPPRRRETEPVVRRWAECCCHSFNLRPFCDPISAREQSSLQRDVAPARASSPSDGETDGFPAFSCLVCLFVSFPICPFHRAVAAAAAAAAAAAIRLCFIHDWLWRLRSPLREDRG